MYSSVDIVSVLVKDFDRSLESFENINNDFDVDKPFTPDQRVMFEEIVRKSLNMFAFQQKPTSVYITLHIRFAKGDESLHNKCKVDGFPCYNDKYKKINLNKFSNVSAHFQALNSVLAKELDKVRIALDDPRYKTAMNRSSFKNLSKALSVTCNPYFLINGLGTQNYKNINIKKMQINIAFNFEKEKIIFRISEDQYKEYNDPGNSNPKVTEKFCELIKWIGEKSKNNATTITNLVIPDSVTLKADGFANTSLAKAYEKFSLKQDIDDEKNGIDNEFLREELEKCEHTKARDSGFTLALAQLGKPSVVTCNIKYNVKCMVDFSYTSTTNDFFKIDGYEDEDDEIDDGQAETSQIIYEEFIEKNFNSILRMEKEQKPINLLKKRGNVFSKNIINESLLQQMQNEELLDKSDVESEEEAAEE